MAPVSTNYSVLWENMPEFKGWLRKSDKPNCQTRAKCIWCNSDFSVANGGLYYVRKHMGSEEHRNIAKARLKQKSFVDYAGKILFRILVFSSK